MGNISLMYSKATYYFDEMILKKDFDLGMLDGCDYILSDKHFNYYRNMTTRKVIAVED